jgi:hypothetical protein
LEPLLRSRGRILPGQRGVQALLQDDHLLPL